MKDVGVTRGDVGALSVFVSVVLSDWLSESDSLLSTSVVAVSIWVVLSSMSGPLVFSG